jgi:RNA polymerase-binding transcription factor DksA
MKKKRAVKLKANATAPAVPQRWAWHYRSLLALRDRLLAGRGALLQAATEPLEPHSLNEADTATDEFDHDLALAELSAQQDGLGEVDQALKRILDGTYGVCEQSGKRISAARLKAVLWTRFARDVAEGLEKKGAVAGPHLGNVERLNHAKRLFSEEEEPEPADEALWHQPLPSGGRIQRPKRVETRGTHRRPTTQKVKSKRVKLKWNQKPHSD